MGDPWVNPDGSTNVAAFLAAYADDDNTFWRADTGHIQNVLDEVLGQLADARGESERFRDALREILASYFDTARHDALADENRRLREALSYAHEWADSGSDNHAGLWYVTRCALDGDITLDELRHHRQDIADWVAAGKPDPLAASPPGVAARGEDEDRA